MFEVVIGNVYTAKISDRLVEVRIDADHERKGWWATNLATGKKVHIKSPQKLRREISTITAEPAECSEPAPPPPAEPKATSLSGLDAAAIVLKEHGAPMETRLLVDTMLEKGYWSTNGKTPHATIYSAIAREIAHKGETSRFKKVGRGLFGLNA